MCYATIDKFKNLATQTIMNCSCMHSWFRALSQTIARSRLQFVAQIWMHKIRRSEQNPASKSWCGGSSDRMTWNFQSLLARRRGCMNLKYRFDEASKVGEAHIKTALDICKSYGPYSVTISRAIPWRHCSIMQNCVLIAHDKMNWVWKRKQREAAPSVLTHPKTWGSTFSRLSAMLKARSRSHLSSSTSTWLLTFSLRTWRISCWFCG